MTLAPGSTLGPYTILAELGHGGMGVVYTAQDPRLDRQVAIKVLPPDLTRDDTAKLRFLQEGISFLGQAFSEPRLLALGYAFEQVTKARRLPVNTPVLTAKAIRSLK